MPHLPPLQGQRLHPGERMMAREGLTRSQRQYIRHSPALVVARELPGIRVAPFPDFIEPALATLGRPPAGDKWIHEIKFDGYRAQLHKRDAGSKMFTRRGYDWTGRFRHIVGSASALKTQAAVLDGEVIILTDEDAPISLRWKATLLREGRTAWSSTRSIFSISKRSICGAVRFWTGSACFRRCSKTLKVLSDTASISKRTARMSTVMPARWSWKASSQSAWMGSMNPAATLNG